RWVLGETDLLQPAGVVDGVVSGYRGYHVQGLFDNWIRTRNPGMTINSQRKPGHCLDLGLGAKSLAHRM
ncbi:MAG: hypothetical protein ACI92A_002576, partial [Candidatus Paceibacteria bacterium]